MPRRVLLLTAGVLLGCGTGGDGAPDGGDTSADAEDTAGEVAADTVSDAISPDASDTVGDATPDTGDTTADSDTSDVPVTAYRVLYEGRWDDEEALLGTDLPPVVEGVGRPGAMLGPPSITVGPMGLLVLDPARDRVAQLGVDSSGTSTWASDPFYRRATDLLVDPDGVAWAMDTVGCRCVRRLDGADPPHEAPVVPEALGLPLMSDGDGDVYLAMADGAERWVVHVGDRAMTLEEQRDSGGARDPPSSPVALGWGARITAPPETALELVNAFGAVTPVIVPGRPLAIELLQLVHGATCTPSILGVAKVATEDGLVHAVFRVDLQGVTLHQDHAPAQAPYSAPLRAFTALEEGRLFQLRTDGGGYAIVEWDIGCP